MQTSRFQLGLIATLAVGLGFSLASSDAVGYPAGAAVSAGENPIVSGTGQLETTATAVFSVPVDQRLIITDIITSARTGSTSSCPSSYSKELWIETSSGELLARIGLHGLTSTANLLSYRTGLVVPPGETVTVRRTGSCSSGIYLNYSISGYYAQP